MQDTEIWEEIPFGARRYQISSLGRFKDNVSGRITKGGKTVGYYVACFHRSVFGVKKRIYVHQLVAMAFIPNPENKPHVNHKNGIKTDNRMDNLEWCTQKENMQHAVKHSLLRVGSSVTNSKLTESDADKIRSLFKEGMRQRDIVKLYPVNQSVISRIIRNKKWLYTPGFPGLCIDS